MQLGYITFFSMEPISSPSTLVKGILLLPTQVTEDALSEKLEASSIPKRPAKNKQTTFKFDPQSNFCVQKSDTANNLFTGANHNKVGLENN